MAGSETRVTGASTRHPDHDLTVGRGRVWPALSLTGVLLALAAIACELLALA